MQKVTVSNQDVRDEVTLMHVNNHRGLNNDFRTIVSDSYPTEIRVSCNKYYGLTSYLKISALRLH